MRVRFGPFVFDSGTRQLLEGTRPLHLSPKSLDLLQILLERRPALVSKSELQDLLWPDAVVLEANLANAVAEIRKVLDDDPKAPTFIFTVSRRGYRFGADVEALGAPGGMPAQRPVRWWLTWKDTVLPLADGENIVGRSPDSDVWIDAKSVSRVHARIVIAGGQAGIEDRGSTNGTYVEGKRIAVRHPLVDGTAITFGSENTVFRQWSEDEAGAGTERVTR
jgi:DNA-binding winged helix-turn-helix (wHTH) protein